MFKFFRGERNEETAAAAQSGVADRSQRVPRRSSGMGEFSKVISSLEELTILDLGPTSPQNIAQLTERGHRVYNEDVLLASMSPEFATNGSEEAVSAGVERFLAENLKYEPRQFDAVLMWDIPDYLNEPLVKPMIERLATITKPGATVLAFFHTRDAGPDAPYYRYHIAGKDMLDLQRGPQFRLQRIFNNRHIENLFREFGSLKFFLARDNVREVLIVR